MSQEPISGVQAFDDDDSPRARAWRQAQEATAQWAAEDATASAEESAQAGHVQTDTTAHVQGVDAVSSTAASTMGAVLSVDPVDERGIVLAAMQAEALAHLEIPAHANEVVAGVREASKMDVDAQLETQQALLERYHDKKGNVRELQKDANSHIVPEDFVGATRETEYSDARERQEAARQHGDQAPRAQASAAATTAAPAAVAPPPEPLVAFDPVPAPVTDGPVEVGTHPRPQDEHHLEEDRLRRSLQEHNDEQEP